MPNFIFKPTRREAEAQRRESLSREGLSPQKFRGTASSAEEAHDRQRALEREGETFDKFWAVDNASKDAKQADQDTKLKHGLNPDGGGYLNSESTRHE